MDVKATNNLPLRTQRTSSSPDDFLDLVKWYLPNKFFDFPKFFGIKLLSMKKRNLN